MKSAIAIAFAAIVAAAPTPQAGTTEPLRFSGLSLRSASPIHFGQINANGLAFWVHKNTTTYCPKESVGELCDSSNTNTTVFSYLNGAGTLGLSTEVPGGQQVYVTEGSDGQLAGQLKFTQAHSVATSGPALYKGFSIVADATLQFEGKGWLACPLGEGTSAYGIWAESRVAGQNAGSQCLGFNWRVVQLDEKTPDAWQYVK